MVLIGYLIMMMIDAVRSTEYLSYQGLFSELTVSDSFALAKSGVNSQKLLIHPIRVQLRNRSHVRNELHGGKQLSLTTGSVAEWSLPEAATELG